MTQLLGQWMEQRLRTKCERCKDDKAWLTSLIGVDGQRSIHLIACRTPSCHFLEIRSAADADVARPLRARIGRAERAVHAWRITALAAVALWPLIVFVMMLLG